MSIITLVIIILVCGFVCYAVYQFGTGIPSGFKYLIYCVLMGACIIYALSAFGILSGLNVAVPRVR